MDIPLTSELRTVTYLCADNLFTLLIQDQSKLLLSVPFILIPFFS